MKFRVGQLYQCDRHWGVFKCVSRVDGVGYFKMINEDKMILSEDTKTSDDGTWTEVPRDHVPEKYYYIEE